LLKNTSNNMNINRYPIPRSIFWPSILMLLSALFMPMAQPLQGQGSLFAVDQAQVQFNLMPGQQAQQTIRLTNLSSSIQTPRIFEAHPPVQQQLGKPVSVPLRAALPDQATKLDPAISEMSMYVETPLDMLIVLQEQADLSRALAIRDWASRGQYVYQTLKQHADRSQADLRASLTAQQIPYRPLWIVNALRIRGTPSKAQELATRSDIAAILADTPQPVLPPSIQATANPACNPDDPDQPVCWNIQAVGADRVWQEFGVDGQGVTVATIDTGALFSHPALLTNYRGYQAAGSYDHRYNWYDPQGVLVTPADRIGHGTHVLGTMVGKGNGTASQPAIGLAPGAQWIAAQGCESDCSEGDLLAAAEWLLAPTDLQGNNPRPDLRPMVVNNSWGGASGNPWYSGYIAAWRAAGIIPVFAAGNVTINTSTVCGSVASPADDSQVIAVGALDHQNQIAPFSLRGPSYNGAIKPDLVAPGTHTSGVLGIYSSTIGSSGVAYQGLQGTSMAAPHVAGAIALMLSANPALIGDYEAVYAALTSSAYALANASCGEASQVPNNTYGYGALDAFAAVAQVRIDLPWLAISSLPALAAGQSANLALSVDATKIPAPGRYEAQIQIYASDLSSEPTTIEVEVEIDSENPLVMVSGIVTDGETGLPLMANVSIGAVTTTTNAQGAYQLAVSAGSYQLNISALGYFSQVHNLGLLTQSRSADIVLLPDQPRLAVAHQATQTSPPIGGFVELPLQIINEGTRPLHYQTVVMPETFGVWRSDEAGGPTPGIIQLLPDVLPLVIEPDGVVEMPLEFAFPFFGEHFQSIYIGSNGVVSFIAPFASDQPTTRCQPDRQIYLFSAAPFWADLDLRGGGQIRATHLNPQTVVVSYENIPLRDAQNDDTFSFQVVVHGDGRITFRYGELGELPAVLGVGVQRVPGDDQLLGCGVGAPPTSGLALELRPQPAADTWLSGATSGEVAPMSEQTTLLHGRWIPPGQWPWRARVLVLSSDPTQPVTEVTYTMAPLPAPYQANLPTISR
jgi:hypothetical protein